jgi:tRNA 2-thiouridine synthesizing protein B
MLHIINQSPYTSESLKRCEKMLGDSDVILLIEEGVYAAMTDTSISEVTTKILEKNKIFVLESDAQACGITEKIMPDIALISYEEFVDLTIQHHPILNWSK